jgi:hypothetical protein
MYAPDSFRKSWGFLHRLKKKLKKYEKFAAKRGFSEST